MVSAKVAVLIVTALNATAFGSIVVDSKAETFVGTAKRGTTTADVVDSKGNISIVAGSPSLSVFAYNGQMVAGGEEVVAQGSSTTPLAYVPDGFTLTSSSSLNPAVFAPIGAANLEYANTFRFHVNAVNANVTFSATVANAHNPPTDLTSVFPGWDQVFSLQLKQYGTNYAGTPSLLYSESRPLGGTFIGKSTSLAPGYYEAIVRFEEITNGQSGFPPVNASYSLSARNVVPEPIGLMTVLVFVSATAVRRRSMPAR